MINILILDDDLERVETIRGRCGPACRLTHVLDRESFRSAVATSKYDIIMLDHDLGWEQDNNGWSGSTAAKIIAANRTYFGDPQIVVIHSMNSVGAANMAAIMAQPDHLTVFVIPGAWSKIKVVDQKLVFTI